MQASRELLHETDGVNDLNMHLNSFLEYVVSVVLLIFQLQDLPIKIQTLCRDAEAKVQVAGLHRSELIRLL